MHPAAGGVYLSLEVRAVEEDLVPDSHPGLVGAAVRIVLVLEPPVLPRVVLSDRPAAASVNRKMCW